MANVYVRSGAAGAGTGADWANAYTTLAAAFTAKAAGDDFWLADDHAETQASALSLTSPGTSAAPCRVICVNRAGSVPPVSADLRTTATITTSNNNSLTIDSGVAYVYGVSFSSGGAAAINPLNVLTGSSGGAWTFESCALTKAGSGAATGGSAIIVGSTTAAVVATVKLANTTIKIGNVADGIVVRGADFSWRNTPAAIAGATVPSSGLFRGGSALGGMVMIEGVDLSAIAAGNPIVSVISAAKKFFLKDCKIASGVVIALTPTAIGGAETFVVRSDSAGTAYVQGRYHYLGTETTETVIVRTSGATVNGTNISKNITTTAGAKPQFPYEAMPIAMKNIVVGAPVVGANLTVKLKGIWNAAALPNNDDIWFDVAYMGSAASPMGSFATCGKANPLAIAAAHTASVQSWDSLVTARANSTAYTVGQVRAVASNPGRIFFCTTAGTSAASEPAGYASAVDGSSVTDSTAVFRAGVRFSMDVTLASPQPGMAGEIYLYLKAGKASTTFYVGPSPLLS